MSDEYGRIEVMTWTARQPRWSVQKLRVVEESCELRESVSDSARRPWRRELYSDSPAPGQGDIAIEHPSEVQRTPNISAAASL